jgi:hypothetical protein
MRKFTGLLIATMTLAFVVASSGRADASFMLQLQESGFATLQITDNGAGDSNPAIGQITFLGPYGDYALNVDTGTSYPAPGGGTPAKPLVDLSYNASSSTGGLDPAALVISLSQTGFTGLGGGTFSIAGTSSGSGDLTTDAVYWSQLNTDFALTHQIGGTLTLPGGNGFQAGFGAGPNSSPYSLTEVVTIDHSAGDHNSTGDALLTVPEPASMALFGLGMLAVAARRRRQLV